MKQINKAILISTLAFFNVSVATNAKNMIELNQEIKVTTHTPVDSFYSILPVKADSIAIRGLIPLFAIVCK